MKKVVSEFMIKDPVCVDTDANIKSLNNLINVRGYSHLPVLEEGKLVGIVSKTDLMSRFLKMLEQTSGKVYTALLMKHLSVKELMTENPVRVLQTDSIDYAVELLLQREFHSLVVVNEIEEVVGIITSYDLLEALYDDTLIKI